MSRDYFRVSVHRPFEKKRLWAMGAPSAVRVFPDLDSAHKYSHASVPYVVAALRREYPDQVVTVY